MNKCRPKRHIVLTYGVLPNHNCLIDFRPRTEWDYLILSDKVLLQKKPISLYLSIEDFNLNFTEA